MIIDSHVHIYPNKIALKASEHIGKFYSIPMGYDGTVKMLLEEGEKDGIDKFLVHSVATDESQVISINSFIASQVSLYPDKFIGFGTMHPAFEEIEKEVDRMRSLGLKGVKLHPDFQAFAADSEEAFRIYRAIEGKLPLLIHAGDKRHGLSSPWRIQKILDAFPNLTLIAAHFGGWSEWDKVIGTLKGANLYVDTSSSFYALSDEEIIEFINYFGSDKVLFGTDYPMWEAKKEIKRLNDLPLSLEVKENILGTNAAKLLL